ncbi:MAG: hypothetical protein U0235_00745 [Polyangiaceae bacterium]
MSFGEVAGRARELAEDQDASLVVARGGELLCDRFIPSCRLLT